MTEEISFKDFDKLYLQPATEWDFTKFKIACLKCGSDKVEYAGKTAVGCGYYGEVNFEHKIIVKCHGCGNALAMKLEDRGENNYCPDYN
jgi:ribosomal protein S27E